MGKSVKGCFCSDPLSVIARERSDRGNPYLHAHSHTTMDSGAHPLLRSFARKQSTGLFSNVASLLAMTTEADRGSEQKPRDQRLTGARGCMLSY
jgi:hypothetical protein